MKRRRPGKPLTHVARDGSARMVDVSPTLATVRMARARGRIRMGLVAFDAIRLHAIKKGDVLSVARIAGIMAAKKTAELVPLCHPLRLDHINVELTLDRKLPGVRVEAEVRTTGQTGVEMEAIVAVSVALVTVYDMAKSADRMMEIGDISLIEKSGGKSDFNIGD
ncbi:MAG TPA: cyclic pyranopterin monophosphate synthase MoaC [Gemmatimonadaceae bacterium]